MKGLSLSSICEYMLEILYSFLIQQRELFLPGMGNLRLVTSEAGYDTVHQELRPPVVSLELGSERVVAQKALFSYIARKKSCSELEAMQAFNACVYEMRQQLKSGGTVEWKQVGVFAAGDGVADIRLKPSNLAQAYLVAVPAVAIIRKERQHPVLVGNEETDSHNMQARLFGAPPKKKMHWAWVALILAVIGLAFLAYHTYATGAERSSKTRTPGSVIGNQQMVTPQ